VIDAPDVRTMEAILASVASGAIVSATGVMPTPRISTFSLTISSCASR
jgi:hypothetical protein